MCFISGDSDLTDMPSSTYLYKKKSINSIQANRVGIKWTTQAAVL